MNEPPKDEPVVRVDSNVRRVNSAFVYDQLKPNQSVNIAALGSTQIIIDDENLDLDRVNLDNLRKGWDRDREAFTQRCLNAGITLDPFEVYKYYHIQSKVFRILGKPVAVAGLRGERKLGNKFALSQARGQAKCSEYALAAAFIGQKIGEPVSLVIGMTPIDENGKEWREPHAYIWHNRLNIAFDPVLAQSSSDLPVLMQPPQGTTFQTLEDGFDIKCRQIGSGFERVYGLEPLGFGIKLQEPRSTAPTG